MQDTVTSLASRKSLIAHLDARFANADVERALGGFALLMVSLDAFNALRRDHGDAAAEEMLRAAAARMIDTLRDSDFLARMDGGQFMVVIPQVSDHATAARVAEKLQAAFAEPAVLASTPGHQVSLAAHIGIGLFPADADTREVLIQRAFEDLELTDG